MVFQKQINKNNNKHEFAFYFSDIALIAEQGKEYLLTQSELVHRVVRIVKIAINDQFVLFNQDQHLVVCLRSCSKREIVIQTLAIQDNQVLMPHIIFLLPVLKKDYLESAVYSLAELGVNIIQLVFTQKSRQKTMTEKEFDRLSKVAISAAEQSKHYAFPAIEKPQLLKDHVFTLEKSRNKILFDGTGDSFFVVKSSLQYSNHYLLAGPEGGLTAGELDFLLQQDFKRCALTSTVLRSVQAVTIGSSLFRLQ